MGTMRIPKSFVMPSIGLLALRAKTLPPVGIEEEKHDRIKRLLMHFADEDVSTYIHEWGHILQNVYYPYLYLRGARELALVDKIMIDLRRSASPLRSHALHLRDDALESFHLDSTDFRFTEAAGGGFVIGPRTGKRGPQDISEIDLLEEANSIFEFKILFGGDGSAADYEHWLRSGAKYTRTYKMLARAYGSRFAYHMLPPLVAASYHTTYPVSAFAALLRNRDVTCGAFEDFDADFVEAMLVRMLSRSGPRLGIDTRTLFRLPTEDEFAFLDGETMASIVPQTQQSPLHLLAESVWLRPANPTRAWLYRPFDFIKNRGHRVRSEIEHLQPPLALIFFEDEPVLRGGAVGMVSEFYQKAPVPSWWGDTDGTSWPNVFEVLYSRRVLIQNLVAGMSSAGDRFCPHVACPLHNSGLCDGFFILPKEFGECRFPVYMRSFVHRTYDPQDASLRR